MIDLDAVASSSLIQKKKEHGLARRFVEEMQIKVASVTQKLRSLSGGNQQKVLVSKLLSVSPKVVLMDEPTRGHRHRRQEPDLPSPAAPGLPGRRGHHDFLRASRRWSGVCDRVLVMYEGRVCATLAGGDINEESIIQKACLSEG